MHAADVGRLAANLNALDPLPVRRRDDDLQAGRMEVAVSAFAQAVEAACSAAFYLQSAAQQGAGGCMDLEHLERIEATMRTAVARYETALAAVRHKHAGVWP